MLWQEGYHPVELSTALIMKQKLAYLHDNPLRLDLWRKPSIIYILLQEIIAVIRECWILILFIDYYKLRIRDANYRLGTHTYASQFGTLQRFAPMYYNPATNKTVIVPVHGGKDMKKGTFLAVIKQAGLDKNDLT